MRIVVQGQEDGDDKEILRHMPKAVCEEYAAWLAQEPELCKSRLVTMYKARNNNQRGLVPLKGVNNWKPVPTHRIPWSLAIHPP